MEEWPKDEVAFFLEHRVTQILSQRYTKFLKIFYVFCVLEWNADEKDCFANADLSRFLFKNSPPLEEWPKDEVAFSCNTELHEVMHRVTRCFLFTPAFFYKYISNVHSFGL